MRYLLKNKFKGHFKSHFYELKQPLKLFFHNFQISQTTYNDNLDNAVYIYRKLALLGSDQKPKNQIFEFSSGQKHLC